MAGQHVDKLSSSDITAIVYVPPEARGYQAGHSTVTGVEAKSA